MEAVRTELRRLGRAQARHVGGRRAARVHLLVLFVAIVLAFVHRAFVRLPVLDRLEGRWLAAFLAGAVLLALGPFLRRLLAWAATPGERKLARELDDRHHWHDSMDTATSLSRERASHTLGALLAAQAGGRLRDLGAAGTAAPAVRRRWPRVLLLLLFVAVLLLPGVDGWFGVRGGGRLGDGSLGSEGPDSAAGAPRPMRADFWMQSFIENPLPVEPLPEAKEPPK